MKSVIAGVLGLAIGVAGVLRVAHPGLTPDAVPTFTVEQTPFVERVTAEGALRAVTSTPVIVPDIPTVVLTPFTPKVAWVAQDGITVKAGEAIVRFEPADATKQLQEIEAELEKTTAALHKEQILTAAGLADHLDNAALAREIAAQRQRFQQSDALVFSRNQIKEADLETKLAVATQVEAERAIGSERVMARARVALAEISRDRARVSVGRAKTALANMTIHAPADGILVLRRNEHGDVPRPGEPMYSNNTIAEIPLVDTMEVELFVLEVDGSGLEVDQPAEVVIESHPELTFHGKIRLVDKLAKPRQYRVPVQYFSVVVALDRTDRAIMKPGQRVHGSLVLDREEALVVPRQAVFERAGQSFVYRRGAQGFAPVPVVLGAATAGLVVVRSGLAAGDVIAQREPAQETP